MQFSNIKWIIPLMGTFSLVAQAQIMSLTRASLTCGLLMDDIYCFSQDKANITINKLDIKHNKESSLEFLNGLSWNPIKSNSTGINIESRLDSQVAVLTDGKQILFNGGYNSMNTPLADQTIVYNAQKNAWVKVQNPVGNKPIYSGSATALSLGKTAFFGGQDQRIDSAGTNISAAHTNVTGYSQLTLYDTLNNVWSIYTPQTNTPTTISSFYQSSVFYSNTIYYFGGLYYNTATPNNGPLKHSMAYAITFNFNTGVWGNQSLGGPITPTGRIFHTTTLLPSTGRDVLLYGGSDGVTQSEDYVYVLNLDNLRWSEEHILPPYNAVMTRSNHAAVMANKNSLFIISDPSVSPKTDMIILDVSTPSSVRYADFYSESKSVSDRYGSSDYSGASIEGFSEKPEMIAAAVCSIIGFILIIAGIIFCVRKRKRSRAKRFEEEQNKAQIMQLQETRYQEQHQQEKRSIPPPAPLLTQSYDQPPMSPPPPYNPQILNNNASTSQWSSNDGKRFYNSSKPHEAATVSPFVQNNAASSSSSGAQQGSSSSQGYSEHLSSSTKTMMPK